MAPLKVRKGRNAATVGQTQREGEELLLKPAGGLGDA